MHDSAVCQYAIKKTELEKILSVIAMPGMFFWAKDRQSRYIFCNEMHAAAAGLDSPQQLIKCTDDMMCWKSRAALYQQTDRLVMHEHNLYVNNIEKVQTIQGELTMLVTKYKLLDNEGNCIGVAGTNIDVSNYCLFKKTGCFDNDNKFFYFDNSNQDHYLTKRELDVLKFLMCGFTAKKIGARLKISYRTAEAYINILKDKLNCTTKSDIVLTAIKKGLTYLLMDEHA